MRQPIEAFNYLFKMIKSGRLGVSSIPGLAVFLAFTSHGVGANVQAIGLAISMTLVTMCGFIWNDIVDLEKDRRASKDRPIPNMELTVGAALKGSLALCFIGLVLAWLTGNSMVNAVLWVTVLLLAAYSFLSRYLPFSKGLITATLATSPFWLVGAADAELFSPLTVLIVFSFVIFRELALDAIDLQSDTDFGLRTPAVLLGYQNSVQIGWIGSTVSLLIGSMLMDTLPSQLLLAFAAAINLVAVWLYGSSHQAMRFTRISLVLGVVAASVA